MACIRKTRLVRTTVKAACVSAEAHSATAAADVPDAAGACKRGCACISNSKRVILDHGKMFPRENILSWRALVVLSERACVNCSPGPMPMATRDFEQVASKLAYVNCLRAISFRLYFSITSTNSSAFLLHDDDERSLETSAFDSMFTLRGCISS